MQQSGPLYRITKESEGFFKDRASKFYAFAYPVEDVDEVSEKLSQLKKKYYDARHHCYAYRLGKEGEISYATDDGEPSHSAGTPILGKIRSFELSFVMVVVVRYFGGTKLGVRGLIEAYGNAAADALEGNPKEEIIHKVIFVLTFPYEQTSEINRLLHPHPVQLMKADYTDVCEQQFYIRKEDYPGLAQALKQANVTWEMIEED